MSQTITAMQNDTIDAICWRHYGRSAGVVEQVLEANPQLAEYDVFLPMGTTVVLPDITSPEQVQQSINLWD